MNNSIYTKSKAHKRRHITGSSLDSQLNGGFIVISPKISVYKRTFRPTSDFLLFVTLSNKYLIHNLTFQPLSFPFSLDLF